MLRYLSDPIYGLDASRKRKEQPSSMHLSLERKVPAVIDQERKAQSHDLEAQTG